MSEAPKPAHPAALALSALAVVYFGWVVLFAATRPSPLMLAVFVLLIGALLLFCLGNFLMVRVMRENGLGLAISLSLIFQLVAITLMAFVWFGERPTALQLAGLLLGVVAVTMIVWPQGGA